MHLSLESSTMAIRKMLGQAGMNFVGKWPSLFHKNDNDKEKKVLKTKHSITLMRLSLESSTMAI